MKELEAIDYGALGIMGLNIFSSVGVVFFNKWLFDNLSFSFPYTLVLLHFVFTTLGLVLCMFAGVFKFKRIPLGPIIPLSASFCGFVLLTNVSLKYNSVGFFQICKVLTTPVIMVLQLVFFQQPSNMPTVLTLGIVCAGVLIATVTDVSATTFGTFIALSGTVITSFYQIWVGTYQSKYQVNSPQLLMYQAPMSAVFLLLAWPWAENTETLLEYDWHNQEFWILLIFSCLSAFFVNLSTFLLIGRTSPLTYNAVGHFKLSAIIAGGYLLFGQPATFENLLGVFITFIGLFAYTKVKLQEQADKKKEEKESLPTKLTKV